MNNTHYLKTLVDAVQTNATVSISGTVPISNSYLADLGDISTNSMILADAVTSNKFQCEITNTAAVSNSYFADLGDIKTNTSDTASQAADITTNTGVIAGAISANKFQCNITNSPAVTVTSGSVSVSNFPATQPVSGTVSIGNTPSVTVSSGSINATCSGTVAISGTSSNNITQLGGNSIATNSGVSGAGCLRINVATDDAVYANLYGLLADARYLTTHYTAMTVGGYGVIKDTQQPLPNDASATYNYSNVGPMDGFGGSIKYTSSDTTKDYNGAASGAQEWIIWSYVSNSSTKSSQGYQPSASDGTDSFSPSPAIYEYNRIYTDITSSIAYNFGNIIWQNNGNSKYCRFIPAQYAEAPFWYVQVPGNGGRLFLDTLDIVSTDSTAGHDLYVKIYNQIWNSSMAKLVEYVLFEIHVLAGQNKTIDLKGLPSIAVNEKFAPASSYLNTVWVMVNTSPAATSNGSVHLKCRIYRS